MSTEDVKELIYANPMYINEWSDLDWKMWFALNKPVFEHPKFKENITKCL